MAEMSEVANVIDKIGEGFAAFKAKQEETVSELRKTVDRLETKLARPGAMTTSAEGEQGAPRMLKTQDGRDLPYLAARQKFADMRARYARRRLQYWRVLPLCAARLERRQSRKRSCSGSYRLGFHRD